MLALHKNMKVADQEARIEYRRAIEQLCELAETLPLMERMVFQLYYQHGYSMRDIARFSGFHEGTISRRLKKIAKKLEVMLLGDFEPSAAGLSRQQL